MNWTDKINITNEDNMTLMSRYPDNYFDLAIVDPPYGIGKKFKGGKTGKLQFNSIVEKGWDIKPNKEYFDELKRVSKNQIIWGGNYFELHSYRTFVVWDKMIYMPSMSQVEMAITSFDTPARLIKISSNQNGRIHPTQKPVKLYKWLLQNYAKEGDKILDTHLGSGSIAIACHQMDFELTGCELDAEYYNAAHKRFKEQTAQLRLAV